MAAGDAGPAAPTHLLYLHGFRSSPRSFKAQRLAQWMRTHRPEVHWWCPQLPPSPREAVELLVQGTRDWPAGRSAIVGSSLGGFYATVMGQRLPDARVAVINPAVDPARDLARHIGEQSAFHAPEERFFFRPEFVDELRALQPPAALARPQCWLALVATGDEVLDWREMAARYAACQVRVIPGSDHALSDFDAHLPGLLRFLGLDDRG